MVALYVTAQLLLLALGEPRVQLAGVKLPPAGFENVTVPLGAEAVPDEMSVTVAVHDVLAPWTT
jgi:hypothetical protein